MKKLIYIILGVIIGVPTIIWAAPIFRVERSILPETDSTYYLGTTTPSTVGWLSVITDELCLTGDSCKTAWPTGGGGAGTWATTTSLTAGQLLNYPLNTTDIVMIGHDSATSSAEYWFDPNLPHSFLTYASSTGWSSSYASSTNSFFGNSTIGLFTIGGDIFDELVGTGLQITSGDLQTTLGTSIAASEIADGDHGDFTYTTGVAAIDANAVALTTDTTGNYVSSATTDQGLLLTGTEGASLGFIDCAATEVLKRNAGDTAWECAADATGTGGSGNVATSTAETAGQLSYWTSTAATPATLGKIATGTISVPTGLTITANRSAVGGAAAIALDTGYVIPLQSTLDAKALGATTMTIAGTANQITSSAGAQDLSANRTWTLSLPNHVIFPGSINTQNASSTNATTTSLGVTNLTAASCDVKSNTDGSLYCGTDATGGGGGSNSKWATSSPVVGIFPNAATYVGIGTTTPRFNLQLASSTSQQLVLTDATNNGWAFRNSGGLFYLATSSPTTFATSSASALTIDANGDFTLHGLTLATPLTVANGGTGVATLTDGGVLVGSGTGAVTALSVGTNGQLLIGSSSADPVFATLNCAGNLTCATGAGTLQIDVDDSYLLNTGDIGTGVYDFGGATSFEIVNGAAPTVDTTGEVAIDTTSDQLIGFGASVKRVYGNGNFYPSFTYSTSTAWTGTTTIPLGPAFVAETWNGVKCFTDTGTLNVSFNDATNLMDMLNASTTVGTFGFSTNNTFTSSEKRYVDIGTPASSPKTISCTISKSLSPD